MTADKKISMVFRSATLSWSGEQLPALPRWHGWFFTSFLVGSRLACIPMMVALTRISRADIHAGYHILVE